MYTQALHIAVEDGDPRLFPVVAQGARDMVKGELYQVQYSGIDSATETHYLKTIELKTARFMAACAKMGAIKAGFADGDCQRLYDYGLNLGFAFQIIDDTLDYRTVSDITGKDEGNDYLEGKITLPLLHLLEQGDEAARRDARELLMRPMPSNWPLLKKAVRESGAIEYSVKRAAEYVDRADAILLQYPDCRSRGMLLELSRFFLERTF
jgi:octaprenyl-diphosphate synthase